MLFLGVTRSNYQLVIALEHFPISVNRGIP
jgi:hypothetical protein